MGLDFTYLNLNDVEKVSENIRKNTGMVWAETPTNPLLGLVDIKKLVDTVHQKMTNGSELDSTQRVIVCVDNTFATAWNQQPLKLGADLVMLSSSKFIGGHSDMTGGALITGDKHIAERLNFLKSSIGAIASPFEAYLALRGLKTLAVRMERQCSNAMKVAEFLERHPRVAAVYYPGLPSSPDHELCKRQMRSGGAVVTLCLKTSDELDDRQMMRRFFAKLRYWVLAESLGGVESMINHSASMSHASMTKSQREEVGVYDTTLRLSVGLEDVGDLVSGLENALTL